MSESNSSTPENAKKRKRKNGEGSVWKRKSDGRWCACWFEYDWKGNKRRRTLYAKSEEDAQACLDTTLKTAGPDRGFKGFRGANRGYGHFDGLDDTATSGKVYFAQMSTGGPIKIGTAKRLRTRMLNLQAGCPYPLRVLHVIDGADAKIELELHRRFAHLRLHGEWFKASRDLKKFIAKLREESRGSIS